MAKSIFEGLVISLGVLFALAFAVIVAPPLMASGDTIGALAAGFVNPYATGYSLDAILTGLILIAWIIYERLTLGVKFGWIAIILCFLPGVATAFAFYLVLRTRTRPIQY
ncbi:MAG: DUF2834 domain-containing protein [Alphaproteobacteria bacterium]|nr:DUF2834 domain-containing protein [Alphaproteobacteria bacterium]